VFDNVVLKTELPTSVVASSKDRKIRREGINEEEQAERSSKVA
jgi:hypothetical protein